MRIASGFLIYMDSLLFIFMWFLGKILFQRDWTDVTYLWMLLGKFHVVYVTLGSSYDLVFLGGSDLLQAFRSSWNFWEWLLSRSRSHAQVTFHRRKNGQDPARGRPLTDRRGFKEARSERADGLHVPQALRRHELEWGQATAATGAENARHQEDTGRAVSELPRVF